MFTQDAIKELFKDVSIYVVDRYVAPMERCTDIFGEKATEFAAHLELAKYASSYGIGYFQLNYLTEKGFNIAATYCNIAEYKEEVDKKASEQLADHSKAQ